MRLLLTLLALLTGLSGADRVVASPVTPAAMGSLVIFAEATTQADAAEKARRPADPVPSRRSMCRKPAKPAAPHQPGLLSRGDRALE